jgi:hypothetical protein
MMTLDQKINIADSVFSQEVDNEMVLLDTESEEYFGLDETAAVIWQHLAENGSLREVHASMLAIYDVTAEQLEKDILSFVEKLIDAGLAQLQA